MIKVLLKNRIKKEVKNESYKFILYSIAGITGFLAYKKFKSKSMNKCLRHHNKIDENEYKELKNKIDEFNSRRINDKNNNDASINEMKNIINSMPSSKKNMDSDYY